MQYCSLWHQTLPPSLYIHNWVLFLLWLHLFILSGVLSPLISNSILDNYWPGEFIFQCHIFLPLMLFILFMLFFSRQEYWSGLPFPSPVDHILSELCTMTYLSWVAQHGLTHSFNELPKEAVVHVIILVSFLWLWFSFCLPSHEGERLVQASWWEGLVAETGSCSGG